MAAHRFTSPTAEVETQEGYRLDCDSLMSALIKGGAGRWTPREPRHRADKRGINRMDEEFAEAEKAGFLVEEASAELDVWF